MKSPVRAKPYGIADDQFPNQSDKTAAIRSPKRKQEITGFWVDDYDWIYGGVGFGGFNAAWAGGGCACWFARFKLDYLRRSFVPEPMQYSVSVLDANGNLILRIGQYGNEDSSDKNSLVPLDGDGIGLFHPCFTAVHTDRRVFISDIGNGRIVSALLKYHKDKILSLKNAGKSGSREK